MYSAANMPKTFDVVRVVQDDRRSNLTAVAHTNCADQAEMIRQHLQQQLERVPRSDINYVVRQPSAKKSPIRISPFKLENIYRAEAFYTGNGEIK